MAIKALMLLVFCVSSYKNTPLQLPTSMVLVFILLKSPSFCKTTEKFDRKQP